MAQFRIGQRWVGDGHPTYFVADVAANHDGDVERAKLLIRLAKEAGADAAKFQNFRAPKIVSRYGFERLGRQLSHQAAWKKSVYEVYEDAALPWEWTGELKTECDKAGIDYFSAPYDLEAVDMLDPFVEVFKIGSGDITWVEMLEKVAATAKPVILSTGASTVADVQRAVHVIRARNPDLALLQCNTNYTGSPENFKYVNVAVLQAYRVMFPEVVVGLSDHTPGHATVLGAIALGARVIEKHFTDDVRRTGPDHPFSMDPTTWREMVDRTRELEAALGSPDKRVEDNERETVIVQRRCLRAARDLEIGARLGREMIEALRPAPAEAIPPYELSRVLGRRLRRSLREGEHLTWDVLE